MAHKPSLFHSYTEEQFPVVIVRTGLVRGDVGDLELIEAVADNQAYTIQYTGWTLVAQAWGCTGIG